jgi:LAS superfamily LD-carboxypeptidase LdcB
MRRTGRNRLLLGAVLVVAAIGGALLHQTTSDASLRGVFHLDRGRQATAADGVLPDGVTVFDGGYPGVSRLDPELLRALRRAATDAAAEGITFTVNSGWRSPAHQDQLLREAVDEYGSEEEAARWVAPPERSAHVAGEAVDLGAEAAAWLSAHGGYGLCPTYGNEPWHFERRPEAIGVGCPPPYADPTQDPRMQ